VQAIGPVAGTYRLTKMLGAPAKERRLVCRHIQKVIHSMSTPGRTLPTQVPGQTIGNARGMQGARYVGTCSNGGLTYSHQAMASGGILTIVCMHSACVMAVPELEFVMAGAQPAARIGAAASALVGFGG
jgi:hypothetical protein